MTAFDPIDQLMLPVLELPESAWSAAIDDLCACNVAHADEIRRRFGLLCGLGFHESLPAPTDDLAVPERLGEFQPRERLGRGGMGVVYVARQERLDRLVALKLVRPEQLYFDGARERFRREVTAVARLSHPGIVSVFAVGEEHGVPYLAMELLRGASLDDVVGALAGRRPEELTGADLARVVGDRAGAPVEPAGRETFDGPWTTVCTAIVRRVALAVAHAHEHGIVHRDIKPSNVMVTVEGRVVLLDFGLAQPAGADRMTLAGAHVGSLPYMAPEQIRGEVGDERTDVYGLGVLLREILTLRQPFLAASRETTRERILHGDGRAPATDNRSISWELSAVCGKATEPEPRRRYAGAAGLAQDLDNVLGRRPITARPASPVRRLVRWTQRRPALATGLVLGALAASGTPTAIAIGIAGQRDRARAAETAQVQRAFEASLAAAWAALQMHDVGEARRRLAACPPALRGFEWQHLSLAVDGSLAVMTGHADPVGAVAINRDTSLLASGDAKGTIRLWDLRRGATAHEFTHHDASIWQLSFSADGDRLLANDAAGHTSVVNVATHTVLAERRRASRREAVWLGIDGRAPLVSLGGWRLVELDPQLLTPRREIVLEAVGVAPEQLMVHDDRFLTSVSGRRLDVWDLQTGRSCLRVPDATPTGFVAINVSTGGDRAVLADASGRLLVVEIPSGRSVQVLGGAFAVRDVAFDQTGRYLVAGGRDGSVRCWEVATGRLLGVHLGHDGAISCVAFAGARMLIATAGEDHTVRLWSPFGSPAHFELRGHVGAVTRVAFLPDGDRLVSASQDGSVRVWDTVTGMPLLARLDYPHHVNALAVGAAGHAVSASYHGWLTTMDPSTTAHLPDLKVSDGWIYDLAAAPGRLLIAGQAGCWIAAAAEPSVPQPLAGGSGACNTCALDRAGTVAYAARLSGQVVRWNLAAAQAGTVLCAESSLIADLAVADDDRTLFLVVGNDVVQRDARDGHPIWRRSSSSPARAVASLPGGRRIVTGHDDGSVVFWDAQSGEALLTRKLGDAPVLTVACDPTGRVVAAGCEDGTCQVLRAASAVAAGDVLRTAGLLAARSLHAELRAELRTRDEVLAAIDDHVDLDPEVRAWMRDSERWSLPMPWCVVSAAADLVVQPDLPAERYRSMRRVAEAYLAQVEPGSRLATGVLALASVRLGEPDRALEVTAPLTEADLAASGWPEASLRAARALARHALGDDAGARTDGAPLAALAARPDAPGTTVSLWREVEAALAR
ncbi:MAG: protein kinase [Planctomycetota bacterium]